MWLTVLIVLVFVRWGEFSKDPKDHRHKHKKK